MSTEIPWYKRWWLAIIGVVAAVLAGIVALLVNKPKPPRGQRIIDIDVQTEEKAQASAVESNAKIDALEQRHREKVNGIDAGTRAEFGTIYKDANSKDAKELKDALLKEADDDV